MRAPLLPIALPETAPADARIVDEVITRIGSVINDLATRALVTWARDLQPAPSPADSTDLTLVYAESIAVTRSESWVAVAGAQAPTVATLGCPLAVTFTPVAGATSEAQRQDLNRLLARLRAGGYLAE